MSLLNTNKNIETIDIYVINDGFAKSLEEKLKDLVRQYDNANILFIYPEKIRKRLQANNVKKWAGSYSAYYKLFIEDEISDVDKILYIDSDTIICDDLSDILNVSIDDYACAMVYELINPHIKNHYRINKEFYNSGIVLINLRYWRENNISSLLFEKLSDENFVRSLIFADQDLMILTIYDHIFPLNLSYNFTTMYYYLYRDRFNKKSKLNMNIIYSEEEVERSKNKPKIVHYLDIYTGRPWEKYNNNPFKKLYLEYDEQILFDVDDPKRNRTYIQSMMKLIVLNLCKLIPSRWAENLIYGISDLYAKKIVRDHETDSKL